MESRVLHYRISPQPAGCTADREELLAGEVVRCLAKQTIKLSKNGRIWSDSRGNWRIKQAARRISWKIQKVSVRAEMEQVKLGASRCN